MTQRRLRTNPDSFEDFYTFHHPWAVQDAERISGNANDAEDLASYAFCRALIGWDAFKNKGLVAAERTWLHIVMKNEWIGQKRKTARLDEMDRPIQGKDGGEGGMTVGDSIPGPSGIDEFWAMHYQKYLLTVIEEAETQIRLNPACFGLQEEDFDGYMTGRDLTDDAVAALDVTVRVAVARVRRIVRNLCLARVSEGQEYDLTAEKEEAEEPSDSYRSAYSRDALEQGFDAVMEGMIQGVSAEFVAKRRRADSTATRNVPDDLTQFVPWKRLIVFKTSYSGDGHGTYLTGEETYQVCRRYGIGQGSIGVWLQDLRPPFCSNFEQLYQDLVDRLEECYYYSPITAPKKRLGAFNRRERLMLAGRGYPVPQQKFPPGHQFLHRKFPRVNSEVNQ